MTTDLIVLSFRDEPAALEVLNRLIELQRQHLIRLVDAAVAIRKPDGKLQAKQIHDLTAEGLARGAFWGLFAGILFWMPFFGLALGSLFGALSGSLAENRICHRFIEDVGRSIEPGESALFLLVLEATTDRIVEEISRWKPRVIRTNLSRSQEEKLRVAFSQANLEGHLSHPTRLLKDLSENRG